MILNRVSSLLHGAQNTLYLLWRLWSQLCRAAIGKPLQRLAQRGTAHDRQWRAHPAVATDEQLTFGQRAADELKALVATWTALGLVLLAITLWLAFGGFPAGSDAPGFLHLNLALSCFAALQCFILLIAAKRADQIAATVALHTLDNTQDLKTLIEQNTALTEQVATLTRAVHEHLTATPQQSTPSSPSAPIVAVPSTRSKRRAVPSG